MTAVFGGLETGRQPTSRNISRWERSAKAFVSSEKVVLLIDEIDKADTDFQDDMLDVLDQMQFDIIEIDKTIQAKCRPSLSLPRMQKRIYPILSWALQLSPHCLSGTRHDEKHHRSPFS